MHLRLIINLCPILIFVFVFNTEAQRKNKIRKSSLYVQQKGEYYFIEGEKQFILEDYAKAVTNFKSSIQLIPNNDVAFFKLSQIYNTINQLEAAKLSISKALELNKNNSNYYLLAANIYINANNLKEASKYYEQLISKGMAEEQTFFQLGAIYLYLHNYNKALYTYQRAENYFGINEQATVGKQKIYLKLNKIDKAIAEGQNLMEEFPSNPKYAIMLSEILLANGYEKKALTLLKKLLANTPDVPNIHLQLASLYHQTKEFAKFERELKTAFLNPNTPVHSKINAVMKYLALLPNETLEKVLPSLCDIIVKVHPNNQNVHLFQGDVYSTFINKNLANNQNKRTYQTKAITGYINYIKFDKSKFNVWKNLINLELQQNKFDSVINHGQKALEVFPNQIWLYLVNGIAYFSKKQWKEAIFYFEEGVKRAIDNSQMLELFYGYLGDGYHNIKNNQKSDEYYDKALIINPKNELILNNYSYYLSLRGKNLEKASKMALKLIRINSENLAYLDTYAWVQFKLGNYLEAQKVIEKVITTGVANAENYDHYGDILYKLGKKKEAKKQWIKAKKLDGKTENIDKKIEQGKIVQ